MRTEREGLFVPPLTFARLPYSQDFNAADIAILGLPFDCGTHPTRVGARLGPNAVRQESILTLELIEDAHNDPLTALSAIDAGDVNFSGGGIADINNFYGAAEAAMAAIFEGNCTPVTLGGDGAVTLPQMRAASKFFPGLTVIHFDAHTDTYPLKNNDHFDNATPFTHAANENLIDVNASVHIGTRAPVNATASTQFTESLGYRVLPWSDISGLPVSEANQLIRSTTEGKPIYLCFDMDFFDPSVAPGVATPTPGGPTTFEGLQVLKGLAGLNIVACDINTMSPLYDQNGVTAQLAATVVMECMELVRRR
ncbi:MAG: arginase family protein [Sneathiella sp.]|uniref:arginase family protein n=1 Tax=Sneathiella sp. TaxID=1964365 RepID=UPI0030010A9C